MLLVEHFADDPDRDYGAGDGGDRDSVADGGVEGGEEALGHDRLTATGVPATAGDRTQLRRARCDGGRADNA